MNDWLGHLKHDGSLLAPELLRDRDAAIARLERMLAIGDGAQRDRIEAMIRRFEAADEVLFRAVRAAIRAGEGARVLAAWSETSILAERAADAPDDEGYDHLDALVDGVFAFDPPSDGLRMLSGEMVAYQPTPARHVFDLLARLALTEHDVLVDLGAGLGHVPLLAAICTPARCVGVEIEPVYVDRARRCAAALGIDRATLVASDARMTDLSFGTVFYLYTPFTGGILRDVLDALRRQAEARPLRVCTYGPCTAVVAAEFWLVADAAPTQMRVAVFTPRA